MVTILLQEIRDFVETLLKYASEIPVIRALVEAIEGYVKRIDEDVHELRLYFIDTFKELFTSMHTHVANIQEELHTFRDEANHKLVEIYTAIKETVINKLNEMKAIQTNTDSNVANIRTNVLSTRINSDTIATEIVTIREKDSSIESYMNNLTQGATKSGEAGEKIATNTLNTLNHVKVIDSTVTGAKDDLDGLLLKIDDTNNLLLQILEELKGTQESEGGTNE